jgi:hypothetical protein
MARKFGRRHANPRPRLVSLFYADPTDKYFGKKKYFWRQIVEYKKSEIESRRDLWTVSSKE